MAKKKKAKTNTPDFEIPKIEIQKLYDTALALRTQHPMLRRGQSLHLAYHNEVLCKQTHADQYKVENWLSLHSEVDSFYNDDNIHEFVKLVTGKNDWNAWKVSFTYMLPTPTLAPKVYCGTCKYRTSVFYDEINSDSLCCATMRIASNWYYPAVIKEFCRKVNANNDCKEYKPSWWTRFKTILKGKYD